MFVNVRHQPLGKQPGLRLEDWKLLEGLPRGLVGETRSTFKRKCVAVWVKGNIAVLIGTLPLFVFLSRGCAPGFRLAARARRLRQPP